MALGRRSRPATTVPPVRRQMWRLYTAETLSGAGDGIVWVAVVVVLVDEPRYGLLLTLGVVARLAPRAALSLPAGALIDRSDLRRLLAGTSALRAVTMGLLGLVVARGAPPAAILLLLLLSNVLGCHFIYLFIFFSFFFSGLRTIESCVFVK